jgi:hypothetical protein
MDPGEKALILPGRSARIQMYERIGTQLPELAIYYKRSCQQKDN